MAESDPKLAKARISKSGPPRPDHPVKVACRAVGPGGARYRIPETGFPVRHSAQFTRHPDGRCIYRQSKRRRDESDRRGWAYPPKALVDLADDATSILMNSLTMALKMAACSIWAQ